MFYFEKWSAKGRKYISYFKMSSLSVGVPLKLSKTAAEQQLQTPASVSIDTKLSLPRNTVSLWFVSRSCLVLLHPQLSIKHIQQPGYLKQNKMTESPKNHTSPIYSSNCPTLIDPHILGGLKCSFRLVSIRQWHQLSWELAQVFSAIDQFLRL